MTATFLAANPQSSNHPPSAPEFFATGTVVTGAAGVGAVLEAPAKDPKSPQSSPMLTVNLNNDSCDTRHKA